MAGGAVVGDALDPATQIGPLVGARQRDRVEGYIARGLDEGARLTTGGGRPAGLDQGWFVEPTVLADVGTASVVAQEVIFGPVLTSTPYDGEDEAVRLAIDSAYGLAGTAWRARSGPPTPSTARASPGASAAAPSGSTDTCRTSAPRTGHGVQRPRTGTGPGGTPGVPAVAVGLPAVTSASCSGGRPRPEGRHLLDR
ncbi:aldehyde dehydrogenase family protein [Actinacidiphila glaucinigra]|uniref:aldehyde dehydrogenase family protein n=1 Tax=Actinacidiphila glaucinigra TaxID=235986 RepID=UPI00386E5F62